MMHFTIKINTDLRSRIVGSTTDGHFIHELIAKGGGTLCAGSAAALLVFGPVMPKGELTLLALGVCENWHY
jgi:hypothetical protein